MMHNTRPLPGVVGIKTDGTPVCRALPFKAAQFLDLSTSLLALIHGIIARSFSPTCSIW